MEIPLSIFLIIYALFIVVFLLFAAFSLFHIFKFGFWGAASFWMTFIFIAGGVIILFVSIQEVRTIDWSQTINLLP